jgi:hypothetical protein
MHRLGSRSCHGGIMCGLAGWLGATNNALANFDTA